MSLDRTLARTIAYLAIYGSEYSADETLEPWIREYVDRAIETLVTEDFEAERASTPFEAEKDAVYSFLIDRLGLPETASRGAATRFNHLPLDVRRTCYDLLIEGQDFDSYIARVDNGDRIHDHLRMGFEALAGIERPYEDWPEPEEEF